MHFSQGVESPTPEITKSLESAMLQLERQDTCLLLDILYAPQPQPWSLFAGALVLALSFCLTVRFEIDGRTTFTPRSISFLNSNNMIS